MIILKSMTNWNFIILNLAKNVKEFVLFLVFLVFPPRIILIFTVNYFKIKPNLVFIFFLMYIILIYPSFKYFLFFLGQYQHYVWIINHYRVSWLVYQNNKLLEYFLKLLYYYNINLLYFYKYFKHLQYPFFYLFFPRWLHYYLFFKCF